ncbi:calcium-binding protein [Pasteurella oralis]|uniref:calcium-binding protein n=1 Tax=Pasteurella oralis TaxID=1071947 RepID=UPI000C7D2E7F|nr:calcium-binding protein [Pasteurella oralis]
MPDNKYTVTFKVAQMGDDYIVPIAGDDKSSAGHLWYVLHKNNEFIQSAGFHPKYKEIHGLGEITNLDEGRYVSSFPAITIQINRQQYETLLRFGESNSNAKEMGFDPTIYNGLKHSCVHYVFRALELIGYKFTHDPSWTFPINAFASIRAVLAKNKAIEVKENQLLPLRPNVTPNPLVPGLVNYLRLKKDYEIIGYDDRADYIKGSMGKDHLIGKSGDDILDGGKGNDVLDGGDGFDVYHAGKGDTIIDSDGQGKVLLNNKVLRGGERNSKKDPEGGYRSDDGTVYNWTGGDLTVEGVTIRNFKDGDLGIQLKIKNDKKPDVVEAFRKGDFVTASPLIIDMNGDGVKTLAKDKHNVYFDLDNNGFAQSTGWASQDDALLVLDRNQNNMIDNGSELFGNYTPLKNGENATNGFHALAEFDENQDGLLDKNDAIWAQLKLWKDLNSNGVSEANELINLSESELESIDLAYKNNRYYDSGNNYHGQISKVTWKDKTQTDIIDIWFHNDPSDARALPINSAISEEIALLPNIASFGNMYSLHMAMALKPSLVEKVKSYIQALPEDKESLLDSLIYSWADIQTIPGLRGFMDGQKLDVIVKLGALDSLTKATYAAGPEAAKVLEKEYQKFRQYVAAHIEAQTTYKSIFDSVKLRYDSTYQKAVYDWTQFSLYMTKLKEEGKHTEFETLNKIATNLGTYSTDLNYNYIDRVTSEEGNEGIIGTKGNDTLVGSSINDEFYAGTGNDTIILNQDWGQDIVRLYWKGIGSDIDSVYFNNVSPDDLIIKIVDTDMIISHVNGKDQLTIEQQFKAGYSNNYRENFV